MNKPHNPWYVALAIVVVAACGPQRVQGALTAGADAGNPNSPAPTAPAADANANGNDETMTNPSADTNKVVETQGEADANTVTNPNVPTMPQESLGECGTSATTITYAVHVSPLITQTCGSCHSAGGNAPTMNSYAQSKAAFSAGRALQQVDTRRMPPGRPLTADQLCIFDTWAKTAYAP
jgi:hypothetical protein